MKIKIIILSMFVISQISAISLQREEIEKAKPVNFENYRGRSIYRVDVNEVRKIGRQLSEGLKNRVNYKWNNKYSITRCVDTTQKEKLDADILTIEAAARIDHIHNIWRILAAYISTEFKYDYETALTLAKFVTYYNVVYRGNTKYFGEKYKSKVTANLTARNAGMAIRYTQWPGRTKIVIPLSQDGKKPDTNTITDKKVIDELKKKDDKGIDDRKKIIEIKKDELKKDEKKNDDERKKLENEKKIIEIKKDELKKDQNKLEEKKKNINEITDEKKKEELKKELDQDKKNLDRKKEELEKNQQDLKKKEDKIENNRENNNKKQDEIKKEEQDLKKDKENIEKKKNPDKLIDELDKKTEELKKKEDELQRERDKVIQGKMYYLKVNQYVKDGHYENDMMIIDPISRKVTLKSQVRQIDGHKFDLLENGVVVIVHDQTKGNEHHLVILDKDKLTMLHKSSEDVFWRSFIEIRDSQIYAVIKKNGKFYLGKFDSVLKLANQSQTEMDEDSTISFFQDFIYINRNDKTIVVLKKDDLSFIDIIKP